jgi:hypothetical protein
MAAEADNNTLATYEKLDNGIHKLTLLKSNRAGVDALIVELGKAYDSHPAGETIRIIIDLRPDGMPPMAYAVPKVQGFFKSRVDLPKIRSAYLVRQSVMVSIMMTFLSTLRLSADRRVFDGDKDEEAIAWLLEDKGKEVAES